MPRSDNKKSDAGRARIGRLRTAVFYGTAGSEALPVALIVPVQINGLPPLVPEPLPLVILAVRVSV